MASPRPTASPESHPLVLVVGAGGRNAGLVVPALVARGARVRGMVHDPANADAVRQQGAAEVVTGDLTDPASVRAALDGVDRVFYISPAFLPDEGEVGRRFVALAVEASARRFVFSSVIHPVISALANHIGKAPVEAAAIESGMEYAFLEPALFAQNFDGGLQTAAETGVFTQPWSAETRFSVVDYRDVVEVAAEALTGDRLLWGTYQLCGPGTWDRHEIAAVMGEVLGREVRSGDAAPPACGGGPPAGGASPSSGMQAMTEWYDRHDLVGNGLVLQAVLGREPRTLRDSLADAAQRLGLLH